MLPRLDKKNLVQPLVHVKLRVIIGSMGGEHVECAGYF